MDQNSDSIDIKKPDSVFTTTPEVCLCGKEKGHEDEEIRKRAGASASGIRKPAALLDTDDFRCFDDILSDHDLSIDVEKLREKNKNRKKERIFLDFDAACMVKPKEGTSCNVYGTGRTLMGKKEDFRLNWRISSSGVLSQDFAFRGNTSEVLEPLEISDLDDEGTKSSSKPAEEGDS